MVSFEKYQRNILENVKDQKCTINKFWVKNKIIQNVKDQSAKKPKVVIDVLELLQCHDSERDEVTTPEILLKRKGRDYEMNQRVRGDDKEDYDRSGLWRSRRRREVHAARALFI